MKRDVASGTLLIVGAAAGLVVMGLLPTAHGLMDPESGAHLTRVNVMVHGLALAAVPAAILLLFFVGHLKLDVHGFGIVMLAQSAWMIWIGILLCREGGEAVP